MIDVDLSQHSKSNLVLIIIAAISTLIAFYYLFKELKLKGGKDYLAARNENMQKML